MCVLLERLRKVTFEVCFKDMKPNGGVFRFKVNLESEIACFYGKLMFFLCALRT